MPTPGERALELMLGDPAVLDHAAFNVFSAHRSHADRYGLSQRHIPGTQLRAEWDALTDEQREEWRQAVLTKQRQHISEGH